MGRWLHDDGDLKLEPRSTPPAITGTVCRLVCAHELCVHGLACFFYLYPRRDSTD